MMKLNFEQPSIKQFPQHPLEAGTLHDDEEFGFHSFRSAKRAFLTVIRSRADIGVHTFIDGRALIGRNPVCSFTLHDHKVSGRHAAITQTGDGEFIIEDLDSTNGTRVDSSPVVGPRVLRDGEKIFIGETVIRFSLADELDIDFHSEVATLVGTDPLTDLPSKRRFDEALEFAMSSAIRGNRPIAVLMMDMDGVKQINDTHGHLYGAYVIGETGRLIDQVLKNSPALAKNGQACRFGGDEFSAFLPDQDVESACAIGEEIREAVESAGFEKDGISLRPTISIGAACRSGEAADTIKLISNADEALYRAKAQGKNRVAV